MLFRLFSYITIGGYMKIEHINYQQFLIFFNISYLNCIDFTRDQLLEMVKQLLFKLQDRLLLHGFYKIKVYAHRKVGIFLDLLQIEEFEYSDALDFRITVYLDEKVYFKTDNYFIISDCKTVYFHKNFFYCDVDDISDIMSVIEFGSFVYGRELDMVRKKWQKI